MLKVLFVDRWLCAHDDDDFQCFRTPSLARTQISTIHAVDQMLRYEPELDQIVVHDDLHFLMWNDIDSVSSQQVAENGACTIKLYDPTQLYCELT